MHVACKSCGRRIAVAGRPEGSTSIRGVHAAGVDIKGGAISFGPGGGISFGPGGGIGFGPPTSSEFTCLACGATRSYEPGEIVT
jgi:ribosomal protein S27E